MTTDLLPTPVIAAVKHRIGSIIEAMRAGTIDELQAVLSSSNLLGGVEVADQDMHCVNRKAFELGLVKLSSVVRSGTDVEGRKILAIYLICVIKWTIVSKSTT